MVLHVKPFTESPKAQVQNMGLVAGKSCSCWENTLILSGSLEVHAVKEQVWEYPENEDIVLLSHDVRWHVGFLSGSRHSSLICKKDKLKLTRIREEDIWRPCSRNSYWGSWDACPSVDDGVYPAVFLPYGSSSASETRLGYSRWHSEEKSVGII